MPAPGGSREEGGIGAGRRQRRRAAGCAVLAALVVALPASAQAAVGSRSAAAPDPERNATDVTPWYWLTGATEQQVNDLAKEKGARITSIEVESTSPYRFSAVLVRNDGVFGRSATWWYDRNADGVKKKVDELEARIIDLEPYTVGGERRFAFVLVRNAGAAQKGWWWNYDLTPDQVTADIDKHKIRLIDLDTYVVGGQRRYAYVGITNSGVDAKAWWWYPDVTPEFAGQKAKELGARLIDVEPASSGRLAVVMQKADGAYWWWGLGLSAERLVEVFSSHGVRIVDLEPFVAGGQRLFHFVGVDDTNAESRRLRSFLDKIYDNEQAFGNQVIRGVYVKQIGGPVLADIAGRLRFQPLSTLKLLAYLYVLDQIDRGKASLDGTSVSWTEATKDDSATPEDDRKYKTCLAAGSAGTKSASAKLRDALPTLMWESHNRTLDAIFDKYGPENITERGHALGLADTEMYYGCQKSPSDPPRPWAANRSTLADLGKLFEDVDRGKTFKKASTRQAFFDLMINLAPGGASYTSPITGVKVGPLYSGFLEGIVKREAGPGKQGIVKEFLKHVVLRGKGGSGGPSSDEVGYSDFLHVTLPFRKGSRVVLKTFVAGWFVYKLKTPSGCLDDPPAKQTAACKAIWQPERASLGELKQEMHAAPIRLALATWPKSG